MNRHTTLQRHHIIIACCLYFTGISGQGSVPEDALNTSGQLRRQYHTQSIADQLIKVDGIPDESTWDNVECGKLNQILTVLAGLLK